MNIEKVNEPVTHPLEKHPLNSLPLMTEEEQTELRHSMQNSGFNETFPIVLFEGAVLDGWNRYQQSQALGIEGKYVSFSGTSEEAMQFIVSSLARRNLSSSQRAAIAVESREILERIKAQTEKERRTRQAQTRKANNAVKENDEDLSDNFVTDNPDEEQFDEPEIKAETENAKKDEHANKSSTILAEMVGTNRTYVAEAEKLRNDDPENFQKVLTGEKTISEVKSEKKAAKESPYYNVAQELRKISRQIVAVREQIQIELGEKVLNEFPMVFYFQEQEFNQKISELESLKDCPDCLGAGCGKCENKGFVKIS